MSAYALHYPFKQQWIRTVLEFISKRRYIGYIVRRQESITEYLDKIFIHFTSYNRISSYHKMTPRQMLRNPPHSAQIMTR